MTRLQHHEATCIKDSPECRLHLEILFCSCDVSEGKKGTGSVLFVGCIRQQQVCLWLAFVWPVLRGKNATIHLGVPNGNAQQHANIHDT